MCSEIVTPEVMQLMNVSTEDLSAQIAEVDGKRHISPLIIQMALYLFNM